MKCFFIRRFLALLVVYTFVSDTTFAKMNKAFIENIGQVTDQYQNKRSDVIARYTAADGLNIFLGNTSIHYQWTTENEMYRMDVKLIGANPNAKVSKELPAGFKEQYQLASLKGIAYSFKKMTYHNVYPNVDWLFYFNEQGKLEHDFIVKPGGKVSDIKLQYLGAENLKVDRYGNLVATTKYGSISEPAPYSYEQATNRKVSSSYELNGNVLTFKTGAYSGSLVIDPVIDWATYFGGSEYDEIRDVKIGRDGFVYAVGATNSTTNIATTGSHLTTFQGGANSIGSDAFVTKFDTDGTCIWSTYYGGTNVDMGLSLAVDTAGYLYMAGRTNSQTGIATIGSHQETKAGNVSGYDAFVVKFDTGGTVIWGTYFGGNFNEGGNGFGIAADKFDNIYIAGNTNSSTGIATPGAFQATRPGGEEGFIAKFNTSGILSWATYYGSTANDQINSIASDTSGNIIVVGQTAGTTGLSTTSAYLETGNGGTDGFIAKFDSTGQRMWGTYYGGSDFERLYTVTTDSTNSIYFAGMTNSTADIATSSAHQSSIGSATDAYIGKLNTNGGLEWSTYYGGSDNEAIFDLFFSNGKLLATGWTASPNNIATTDAIVPVYNGSPSEGMLITFSPSGLRLWGTYFGGDMGEGASALAVNADEQVFIAGKTSSVNGYATVGAHQLNFGGDQDGMLLRINMCDVPGTPGAITGNAEVCENSQQQYAVPAISGADSYVWILPAGWSGSSTTDTINAIAGANGGSMKVVALNTCGASDTVLLAVIVDPAPEPVISRSGNILSVLQTFTTYQWLLNGNAIAGATHPTYVATENGTYALEVQGANDCNGTSNEILIDDMTAINELVKLGVQLYPNPFENELDILLPAKLNINIVDMAGRMVKAFDLSKGSHVLDLSSLTPGYYILNVFDPVTNKQLGAAPLVKATR